MAERRTDLKSTIIENLMSSAGAKLPTSTLGRLGRGMGAALRSGGLIMKSSRKRDDVSTDADIKKIVGIIASLGQLKGIAMKMGQIMSYIDIAMPDELKAALSVLQTHAQPMPFEQVAVQVRSALPETGDALLDRMEQTPVSAASIGQVHRACLPDGTSVAVKIQYPEIEEAIRHDFGPAAVGTRLASLFYPQARMDDFVKEARERFLEECDYRHEAHCQRRFQEIYRDHPVLFVPEAYAPYCARTVLTSRFVDGDSFSDYISRDPTPSDRDRIGAALFEFYLGSLFRHAIYNCDPHPGNYLFLADGRVAMLDHGCTRQFETAFVAKLAKLTRAVHEDDRQLIHSALLDLRMVRDDKKYDFDTIRGFLRSFFGAMLEDRTTTMDLSAAMEMREALKKKRQIMKLSLPGEFLFLFRIRFGLMSVLSTLGARANWYRLEKRYVEEFASAHPLLAT